MSTPKTPRKRTATKTTQKEPLAESNIKTILKKLKEIKITAKYCIEQLLYLFVILFAAILIQNMWNFIDSRFFDSQHPITTFEAAVLWICIY